MATAADCTIAKFPTAPVFGPKRIRTPNTGFDNIPQKITVKAENVAAAMVAAGIELHDEHPAADCAGFYMQNEVNPKIVAEFVETLVTKYIYEFSVKWVGCLKEKYTSKISNSAEIWSVATGAEAGFMGTDYTLPKVVVTETFCSTTRPPTVGDQVAPNHIPPLITYPLPSNYFEKNAFGWVVTSTNYQSAGPNEDVHAGNVTYTFEPERRPS